VAEIKIKPKFLFIHPQGENLGIEYLSAVLKMNKFEVELVFLPQPLSNVAFKLFGSSYSIDEEKIKNKIDNFKPEIVCFSPFTSQYQWAVKQAEHIKKRYPSIFILFGGVHVNSVPNMVIKNPYVDAIIIGEADYQIVEFAKKFGSKELDTVASLWIKRGKKIIKNKLAQLPRDLDKLPFPDKDLFYSQIPKQLTNTTYMIIGSRGCPFACTYCSNNVYKKLYSGQNRLRFRSPENIIKELTEAQKKYHFRIVEFFDDVLTIDEERLRPLMKLYRKRVGLPFTCYLHPQLVTEKIIKLLKESKCSWLKLGVQSANEEYRKRFLRRFESNEDIIRASKFCHKYGLEFSLDHIFNLPGETEADLIEAVKLYTICRPTIINFGTLIYLPKTEIIALGLKHKILKQLDIKKINEGKDPVSMMANIDLFSYQYQRHKNVNISMYALMLILTPIVPVWVINFLLKIKIYRMKRRVPKFILIFFKAIGKLKAKQLYIYNSVFKMIFYYTFRKND